jgi:hypothetical protein
VWNTAAKGSGVSYADGAVYAFTADVTLFAQWAAVSPDPGTTFTIDTAKALGLYAIRLRVTVDGPGRFVIVGRYRLQGRSLRTPLRMGCRGTRTVSAAGTYRVTCRFNATTRSLLQRRPLRVGVRVTLTPATGERTTKAKLVRLKRTPARPLPVTG